MAQTLLASGNIASTDLTTIYAGVNIGTVELNPLLLVNKTAKTIDIDLYWDDGSDRGPIKKKIPQGIGATLVIIDMPLALATGNTIKIQAGSTDSFDYALTGSVHS